jgi:hypothetical protein
MLGLLGLNLHAQDQKNALKFLPVNLALNGVSFEYERMINTKNSLELGLCVPTNRTFVNKFSMDWSDDEEISNDELGTFSIRFAYRHYTGKSMLPKGFYLAPYLHFQSLNAKADNIRTMDDDIGRISYNENYDAKVSSFGLGCQLGYQFLIAKKVTLDLYFLGLEGGIGRVDATVYVSNDEQVSVTENDINDAIDDFPSFLRKKIDVSTSGNNIKIKANNILHPWVRGGISLGIAF